MGGVAAGPGLCSRWGRLLDHHAGSAEEAEAWLLCPNSCLKVPSFPHHWRRTCLPSTSMSPGLRRWRCSARRAASSAATTQVCATGFGAGDFITSSGDAQPNEAPKGSETWSITRFLCAPRPASSAAAPIVDHATASKANMVRCRLSRLMFAVVTYSARRRNPCHVRGGPGMPALPPRRASLLADCMSCLVGNYPNQATPAVCSTVYGRPR